MVMFGSNSWGSHAWLTLTVNCTPQLHCFITRAFKILFLGTSLLTTICSHILFSDMSIGGPNIHVVRIQLCVQWKHWELQPVGVSVVHGWVGVASHRAESLSRICLCDFRSQAPALFTEPALADSILGFGSIGPNIWVSPYRVWWSN